MKQYSISFVFPMFNEKENISQTINRADKLAKELTDDYEIIVVDDASTDGSAEAVETIAALDHHIKIIRLKVNSKFGGAIREGLKNASKEVIIYTDFDFPAKECDIKEALSLLEDSDIITGYSLAIKHLRLKRIILSKGYNFLVEFLFGLHIQDINGGFKIYRKKVFKDINLRSSSPFISAEILAEAARKNFRIRQYGLIFEDRQKGISYISKMSILMKTFYDMLVYRFSR
jgi:glycosyltransferase involved in cell wall biosynthesis